MSDLHQKKREIEQELQRISKELRKRKRHQPGGGKVKTKITEGQRNTTRTLMVMRGGEPTAAMAYLKSQHKAAEPTAAIWVEEESKLRSWWNGANEDTKKMHSQIDETNGKLHSAIKQARRFIVDEELESWVAEQNVCKGINPLPAVTLREAKFVKQRSGVSVPNKHKSARQWLQRWRRRKGLRPRSFPAGEPMDKKDLQGKATRR